jgi:hypothetical protein
LFPLHFARIRPPLMGTIGKKIKRKEKRRGKGKERRRQKEE